MMSVAMLLSPSLSVAQTRIIAHRGYWDCDGSAQNSIASLRKAQEINVYGAEFDVHLTRDGIAVISHDDSIGGMNIEESTYDQLRNIRLGNGEWMPTLEQYIIQGKKNKGTQLILEIKPHKTEAAEQRAVTTVLALVKKYKAERITEYISFSMNICRELIRLQPAARVAYLKGDVAPENLKAMGFAGLDYHFRVLQLHPEWISKAKELGLTVNVWTVNDSPMMEELSGKGVDYITTDKPVEALKLLTAR